MTKKIAPDTGDPLNDHAYWARLGAECGRRNEPRTPTGDASVRSMLRNTYESTLNSEHVGVLDELDAMTASWHEVRRALHDAAAQATAGDARAQSNRSMLVAKEARLSQTWDKQCGVYAAALRSITNDARSCDGVWRTANVSSRDRRIVVEPTLLEPPAAVLVLPDKPY